MRQLKLLGVFVIILCNSLVLKTQEVAIGKKSPNLIFRSIVNGEKNEFGLRDLKGKIVIIDFWTTYCLPCVIELKRLDTLQKKYKDSVKFISITYEPKTQVTAFLKKRNDPHIITIVTNGGPFNKYFPYNTVPHFVWIDSHGILLATTSDESLTEENINKVIAGKKVQFVIKDDKVHEDKFALLDSKDPYYRSVFTNYRPELSGIVYGRIPYGFGNTTIRNRILVRNFPIAGLYSVAFEQSHFAKRIIIHSKDSADIAFPKANVDAWSKLHRYCYELVVDTAHVSNINQMMVNEIDQYFGLRGTLEYIDTDCLVITRTSTLEKYRNHGEKPDVYMPDEEGNHQVKYLRNWQFRTLLNLISNMPDILYISDETGISGNVTIETTAPLDDIEGLNRDLEKYDLKIITVKRKIPFIVIRDKEPSTL